MANNSYPNAANLQNQLGQTATGISQGMGQFNAGNGTFGYPQYPSYPVDPQPSWNQVYQLQNQIMALQNQIFTLQEQLHKIKDVKEWLTGPDAEKVAP